RPAMSNPVDSPLAGSLAADPYTSLAVHYGMLLGVSDFQVLVGNPRGKLQLHQAWQHGKGVVWGYGVVVDSGSGQLRVGPGLAVARDGAPRPAALPAHRGNLRQGGRHLGAATRCPGPELRRAARPGP